MGMRLCKSVSALNSMKRSLGRFLATQYNRAPPFQYDWWARGLSIGLNAEASASRPLIGRITDYTSQAQRRDGQSDIFEGLASINQGTTQPYVSTAIVDPHTWLLESNGPGHSALDVQALAIGNPSVLPYKANQPPTNLSGSLDGGGFFDAFFAAQISSAIDLGSTAGRGNVSWIPGHSSSFPAKSETQPITGLQSLTGPTLNDGTSHLPGQFIVPPLPTNSLDWTTGSQFSVDTPLIPTTSQRETFITGTHVTSPPPDHSTPRARGRRPLRCPHEDCDYTSNTLRDVQRHLGSRKHGESPNSFPCLVAGCNFSETTHEETISYAT
ncbi:hypothetical protein BJ166DRAFT_497765 [Pestalotiopsis sp. NC0098]|nr:hypothetical protein BJ166DRAFT_497765 [Pestalotiopsis sp. NC0098]